MQQFEKAVSISEFVRKRADFRAVAPNKKKAQKMAVKATVFVPHALIIAGYEDKIKKLL